MTPLDYYPVGTQYGSHTRSRPHFSRMYNAAAAHHNIFAAAREAGQFERIED